MTALTAREALAAIVAIEPFTASQNAWPQCVFCGASRHLTEGKHFHGCAWAIGKDVIDATKLPAEPAGERA